MRTYVLWTHYDCEVCVSLHSSIDDAYQELKSWLEECDPDNWEDTDCQHTLADNSEIADALEYHWEEMSYDIALLEVPLFQGETTAESSIRNSLQLEPTPPAAVSVTDQQADALLSALQSFQEQG